MTDILAVYATAMLPVVELRGAIPLGVLHYGLDWRVVGLVAVAGNITVVPPLLLLFGRIRARLYRVRVLGGIIKWADGQVAKRQRFVARYGWLGLVGLVAVPLPVTGAWTASIVANIMGLNFKRALASMAIGVCIAGGIVTALALRAVA